MRKFVAFTVALVSAAAPALADEACWSARELTAARVRDLQSVLMVGALQCRASGADVLAEFNKFVVAGRTVIVTQNDVLKARFVRIKGMKEGQRAYDSFTTALANDHSASTTHAPGFCEQARAMAIEATAAISGPQPSDAIELIAERLGERPQGVGPGCADARPNVVIASVAPVPAAPAMASVFTVGIPAGTTVTTTTTTVTTAVPGQD